MAIVVSLAGSSWVSGENTKQSVSFNASHISGNAGCNSFNGTYVQTQNGFKISPLSTTRMACKPDVMKMEFEFLEKLNQTSKIEVSETKLILKDHHGSILTVLTRKELG